MKRAIANIDNEVEEAKKAEENLLRFQEELDEKLLKIMESSGASGLAVQGFAADATPAASASAKTSFSCVSPGPNALSL